jgi:hypothetical protein
VDELVQWLREQLDEDERTARAASHVLRNGAHWSLDEWQGREQPHSLIAQGTAEQPVALGHFTADPVPTEQAEHIVTWDPARVLREIDAKRRLVDLHAKDEYYDGCVICDNGNNSCGCMSGWHWKYPCDTLKILALPYADRPGYQDDWRP